MNGKTPVDGRAFLILAGLLIYCSFEISAADCNSNGVDDAVDVAGAVSADCNLNGVPDECDRASLPFPGLRSLQLTGNGLGVFLDDFNGDGVSDIAVGFRPLSSDNPDTPDPENRGVTVFLSQSEEAGDFDRTVYRLSPSASVWTGGDLDGDGDVDLAAIDSTGLFAFFNAGDGTFVNLTTVASGSGLHALEVGDLNGDGSADLVVANRSDDHVLVALSRGDGTFDEPVTYPVGDNPRGLALGDFDGDGDLDLAAANWGSADVSILHNDGEATFTDVGTLDSVGERPEFVVATDLNGDAIVDLAVAHRNGVSVLLNAGGSVFPAAVPLVTDATTPEALAVADVDLDGNLDIVAAFLRPETILVYRSRGAGEFNAGVPLNITGSVLGMALGDLDSDHDPDLVLTFNWRNSADIALNRDAFKDIAFGVPEEHTLGAKPHTADIGDLDGDGDLDIAVGTNGDDNYVVRLNEGDGTFGPVTRYFPGQMPWSMALGDYDGDGDLDIASSDPSRCRCLKILFNRGDGVFDTWETVSDSGYNDVIQSDVDQDGAVDVVTASGVVLFNNGDATFTPVSVGGGGFAGAADLDGDGDPDLAFAGGSAVAVVLNQGDRVFVPPVIYPVGSGPNALVTADLDLDGHIDLATSNGSSVDVSVLWNLGGRGGEAGTFELAQPVALDLKPHSMIGADLNDDGLAELVTTSQASNSISIVRNNGDRSLELSAVYPVDVGPRFSVAGDLDGDGDVDVVSTNRQGQNMTLLRNATSDNRFEGDYLESICTGTDYSQVSVSTQSGGRTERVTKYVAPARLNEGLIPTVFQNVERFRLHEQFFAGAFPDRFPTVPSGEEYDQLVGRRGTRDYYVGVVSRVRSEGSVVYTFTTVADTAFSPDETLDQSEVEWVYARLRESFSLEPLLYRPDTQLAREAASTWSNVPFEIFLDDGSASGPEFESYTTGVGYGRVRLLTLEEFTEANERGSFTFQDVLVVAEAPRDVEGIIGGFITGTVQGPLSHVAIRTARRGTPNAYVERALEEFSELAGELVRLEVSGTGYTVRLAELSEAEAFWEANRPELPDLPDFDADYAGFDSLMEMELEGAVNPVSRFGGKATNLARLQRLLSGDLAEYREAGFAIPVYYYLEFMRTNRRTVDDRELTYQEFLDEVLSSAEFRSDSEVRFEALDEFRDFVRENGVVDPELISALVQRIEAVFGDTTTMVRFRSSSNVEDALAFNGAGLYESTSVCAQDTLDPASPESSHCDPSRAEERTVERALKKVWSSLWTFRAHEERTFFQIPPEKSAMGLLVNRAFLDEAANGVAFTGNPQNARDRRYMITAQVGEESVVSPEPGTRVERTLLEVSEGGEVVRIVRDRASSLVGEGEVVLSDAHLRELARLMWQVDESYPLDLEGNPRSQVLLDFEFKVEPDGSLAVKQVRPFLIPESVPESPDFELEIPEGTMVCGQFATESPGREPRVEYELKSEVRLVSGVHALPTGVDSFSADLVESVVFGASQEEATALEPGLFRVVSVPAGGQDTTYRFTYEQSFRLPGGETFEIKLVNIELKGRGAEALEKRLLFDEAYQTFDMSMTGKLNGVAAVEYSSCSYALLPRFGVEVDLGGGERISLSERFLATASLTTTGPASLRRAEVELEGRSQSVSDYWRLVYTARRHNTEVRYWVVLDPALELPSVSEPVHALEIIAPQEPLTEGDEPVEPAVIYLDAGFEEISRRAVSSFEKSLVREASFRRGDVDASGAVDVSDAIELLGYLFERGAPPGCRKAADADDSGGLNVADAIGILLHLFGGAGALPEPAACGVDSTTDTLSCDSFPACGT